MTGMIVLTSAQTPSQALDPTVLLTWLTCLATLGSLIVAVLRYGRRIMQMVEDFNGEKERPGVPARPGVMQRLLIIEAEITPNHGSSMKDAVTRMDARLENVESDLTRVHDRLDSNVHP